MDIKHIRFMNKMPYFNTFFTYIKLLIGLFKSKSIKYTVESAKITKIRWINDSFSVASLSIQNILKTMKHFWHAQADLSWHCIYSVVCSMTNARNIQLWMFEIISFHLFDFNWENEKSKYSTRKLIFMQKIG